VDECETEILEIAWVDVIAGAVPRQQETPWLQKPMSEEPQHDSDCRKQLKE
jgi:hypothetical protein